MLKNTRYIKQTGNIFQNRLFGITIRRVFLFTALTPSPTTFLNDE